MGSSEKGEVAAKANNTRTPHDDTPTSRGGTDVKTGGNSRHRKNEEKRGGFKAGP